MLPKLTLQPDVGSLTWRMVISCGVNSSIDDSLYIFISVSYQAHKSRFLHKLFDLLSGDQIKARRMIFPQKKKWFCKHDNYHIIF